MFLHLLKCKDKALSAETFMLLITILYGDYLNCTYVRMN